MMPSLVRKEAPGSLTSFRLAKSPRYRVLCASATACTRFIFDAYLPLRLHNFASATYCGLMFATPIFAAPFHAIGSMDISPSRPRIRSLPLLYALCCEVGQLGNDDTPTHHPLYAATVAAWSHETAYRTDTQDRELTTFTGAFTSPKYDHWQKQH